MQSEPRPGLVLTILIVLLSLCQVSSAAGENFEDRFIFEDLRRLVEDKTLPFFLEGDIYPYLLTFDTKVRKSVYVWHFSGNTVKISREHPTASEYTGACLVYDDKGNCVGFAYSEECEGGYYNAFHEFAPERWLRTGVIEAANSYRGAGDEKLNAYMRYCLRFEINGDDIPDYLAVLHSGRDRAPRGLFAFDGKDASLLWSYPTAGVITSCKVIEVDGSRFRGIICGTHAVGNGRRTAGFTDATANLHCVDLDGNRIWADPVAYFPRQARWSIGDLRGDGDLIMVNVYMTSSADDPNYRVGLQLRDPATGDIMKYRILNKDINSLYAVDMNRDLRDDIVVSSEEGFIKILSADLSDSLTYFHPGAPKLVEITDINDDSDREILGTSSSGTWILDNRLKPLVLNGPREEIGEIFRHPDLGTIAELRDREAGMLKSRLVLIKPAPLPSRLSSYLSGSQPKFLIASLLLGIGVGIIIHAFLSPHKIRERRRRKRESKSEALRKELLESLNAFGHGKLPTRNLDLISMYLSNPIPEGSRYDEYKRRLGKAFDIYLNHTGTVLKSLANNVAVSGIGDAPQELPKLYERIHSFIIRARESDLHRDLISKEGKAIGQDVEMMREKIRQTRASLRRFFSCDPVSVTNDVMKSVSRDLEAKGIAMGRFEISGNPALHAHITVDELTVIAEELIANASVAMEHSPVKKISIKIDRGEETTCVDVTDTGKGIPSDSLERIFSRDYSSKSSGGYGLYYAVQTVEKYAGKIFILGSELDKGTTLRIELKSVN